MEVNGNKNVVCDCDLREVAMSELWMFVTFFYESVDPGQKSSLNDVFTNCEKFSKFLLLWSIKESLTGMEWDKLII